MIGGRSTPLTNLSDLISEKAVYERYGEIFAQHELREARNAGLLAHYHLRKGIFYTEGQLLAYIERRRQEPCENKLLVPEKDDPRASGNSKTSGSGASKKAALTIIDSGTQEMDELIARALGPRT